MTKHTRGPWFAFIKGNTIAIGTGKTGKAIDRIVHWSGFDACGVSLAKQAANARLMAQSPAMQSALEDLLAHIPIEPTKGTAWYRAVKKARAVIAATE